MPNVNELVAAELSKTMARASALRGALAALGGDTTAHVEPVTKPSTPQAKRGAPKGVKRAPASELTKAKMRIAAEKRFGKEPFKEDLDLVATNEGATAPDAVAAE